MEVQVWDGSELDVFGLYELESVRFVAKDRGGKGHLILAERDLTLPHADGELHLGAGEIEKKVISDIDVRWVDVRVDARELDAVTHQIRHALVHFFRRVHDHETVHPLPPEPASLPVIPKPSRPVQIYRELPSSGEHGLLSGRKKVEAETIIPPSPVFQEIRGIDFSPDGTFVASELIEIALQSIIDTDVVLRRMYYGEDIDLGLQEAERSRALETARHQARSAALCKNLFRNVLRRIEAQRFTSFRAVKRRIGE